MFLYVSRLKVYGHCVLVRFALEGMGTVFLYVLRLTFLLLCFSILRAWMSGKFVAPSYSFVASLLFLGLAVNYDRAKIDLIVCLFFVHMCLLGGRCGALRRLRRRPGGR